MLVVVMLNVANKHFKLKVILLNAVMPNVVAPKLVGQTYKHLISFFNGVKMQTNIKKNLLRRH